MSEEKETGVIYILTNPSFKEYVKIGYASDLELKLAQLNRSECIPFAYQVYAVYHTQKPIQDKQLHKLIDQLSPNLRAVDTFDGKSRSREFFAMSPEDAYALLDCVARISGTEDQLHRTTPDGHEILDEIPADEIQEESTERRPPFSFFKCGLEPGTEIVLLNHPEVVATVLDDRHIKYHGETGSLSGLAVDLLGYDHPVQGPKFWTYQGRLLSDIRQEREEQGLYI